MSASDQKAVKGLRKKGAYQKGDERILGDREFVEEALSRAGDSLERRYRLRARGYDFEKVAKRVAEVTGMDRAGYCRRESISRCRPHGVSYIIGG